MNEEKFSAIMGLIIPQVISLMIKEYGYDELEATSELYHSKLYALLEEEETKLWHFSPLTLFNMFDEEKKTGSFFMPEEV